MEREKEKEEEEREEKEEEEEALVCQEASQEFIQCLVFSQASNNLK